MNRLRALILLTLLLSLAGCKSQLSAKFDELDEVLAGEADYRAGFDAETEVLRSRLVRAADTAARWEASEALYRHFVSYQADSARAFIDMMSRCTEGIRDREFAVDMARARVNTSLRDYRSAAAILSAVDTAGLSDSQMAQYYHADLYLDGTMIVDESISREDRDRIMRNRHAKRIAYISCRGISPFEKVRREAIQLYESGRAPEAVAILTKLVETSSELWQKSEAAYSLAYAHIYTGDRIQREYWLAQSAIYSLQIPVKEHMSLYELSNMLFEDQSLARASRYCQVALNDALFCNYNARILNSASSQLAIVQAVDYKSRRDRTSVIIILVTLTALTMALVALLLRVNRQRRRINSIKNLLEEANRIKEGYVFRYIILSANYLKHLENYRHDLRKALREGGLESVKEMLRSPSEDAIDYKSFYRVFDETFLGLFPDFVDKVNSLLRPEARFVLKAHNEMPTALRILAVIKLGLTDSGKIAEFLNSAPSSVYTHRSKIKKEALCRPDDFEAMVRDL